MSTQVQFRRGTTTQNNAFTGAAGELSVDTDLKTIRLHDGTTAGGGATMLNNISAQTALNKTFSTGSVWQGSAVGLGYGGTGSALSAVAGAVAYSGASGLALTAAGTSGQILVSGGTNSPTWVSASSISAGTSALAATATNIAGGSAGQLVIQSDTSLTTFITAGAAGTFLKSAGAGYAPTWAAGAVTIGSTTVALGATATSIGGLDILTATGTSNWTLPVGTTAQRPATPAVGMVRYNTDTVGFEGYASGAWSSLGGVSSVDKFTYIRAETSAGASNGELEFFAEDAAGTAAVKVGGWNYSRLLEATGVLLGTKTTQEVFNTVATTVNAFGAATTLSLGASSGTTTVNNNLTVSGNLTISGTTTTISSTSLSLSDPLIYLATGNSANLNDIGIVGHFNDGTYQHTGLVRDATDGKWKLFSGVITEPSATIDFTTWTKDTLVLGALDHTSSIFNGSTSGTTTVVASATAGSTTLTLPAATDTLVGKATTDTLTNKTIAAGSNTISGLTNTNLSGTAGITNANLANSTISGIALGGTLNTLTLATSGTGLSGSTTYNGSGAATFTVTSNATNLNTASTIVARDISGNFSAGTITATLSGNATNISGTLAVSQGGTGATTTTGTGSNVLSASPTITGTLTVTGNITATTTIAAYFSDDRLKTRTGNIENALEKVLSLDGFHYHPNETAVALGYDGSIQEVGVSAQQVQAVLPEVIAPAPIDPQYMTVHYERLVPLLIEAIKEQQKQIDELKAKLGN